ncbi:MAG TPA: methanogenesis marker 16 metalloprotein [Methanotrichaceae archaeon]|nr:methanogenesis marker 16 metalloprotein [Methanotrichaceae archaeon]
MVKSFPEILRRIEKGEAVVMTSQEVADLVRSGGQADLKEVDVVTTATRAVMSGTYAVLSFPVAHPGSFSRARNVWINGVPARVGPCPNENLGVLDLVVFGTAHSRDSPDYGGGHLFRDLAERKPAIVEVVTDEGKTLQTEVGLDEMPHARIYGSRHAFKNYSAFVNPGDKTVSTIFHAREFEPHCRGATFSGCGQINPVKNDPLLEAIGVGTRILMNGAEGFVTGQGTRSCPERPNLAGFADMHKMNPEYMGGFITSAGPECIVSWAVPIPVTTNTILNEIARPDRDIPLPVMDVNARCCIGQADYGDVWEDVDLCVEFDPQGCSGCTRCQVERICPMKAVSFDGTSSKLDGQRCFHCGLCVSQCPSGAFRCDLGSIRLGGRNVPVVLRQSDRLRALQLAEDLKDRITDGSFRMSRMVERINL